MSQNICTFCGQYHQPWLPRDQAFKEAADAIERWANGWKSRIESGIYDVEQIKAADIRRDEGMDLAKHLRALATMPQTMTHEDDEP